MKQKSFLRLLLETIGFAYAGNLLAIIVTVSLSAIDTDFMMNVAAFCGIALYVVMVFNVGHKYGEYDMKLMRRKIITEPQPNRWIVIGLIVWVLMCVPSIFVLLQPNSPVSMVTLRLVSGSMFALSLAVGEVDKIPEWSPYLFMGIYAMTPVLCRVGHYCGYFEKLTMENIMYKKK